MFLAQLLNIYIFTTDLQLFFNENVPETIEQQGRKDPSLLKNVQILPEMTSLAIKHARRTELRSLEECGYDFESKANFLSECVNAVKKQSVMQMRICNFILRQVASTANNNGRG